MSLKHLLPLLFFSLAFSGLKAQKSFRFEPQLLAESLYEIKHDQSTQIEMDLSAEDKEDQEELLSALEAGGMKLPMVISNIAKVIAKAELTKSKASVLPISITIKDMEMIQISGSEIENLDMSDAIGEKWTSTYTTKDGMRSEDGEESEEAMDALLREMLFFIQTENHWSDGELKKGDKFDTEYPLYVPIPGQSEVELSISTTYEVVKIKGGKAWLKIKQHFDSNAQFEIENEDGPDDALFNMQGDGDGEIVYNIENRFVEDNQLRFEGQLLFSFLGMKMQMEFVTVTDQQIQKL
jgi:hypothetical protein